MKMYLILLLLILGLNGCSLNNAGSADTQIDTANLIKNNQMTGLQKAKFLQHQGRHQEAVIEYRKIMDAAASKSQYQQAQIGIARCLIKIRKYPAAMATLKPLPITPESDLDREVLAIAGEILLRIQEYMEAESILEIALGGIESLEVKDLLQAAQGDITPASDVLSWEAACCGNLGHAYLKNEKLEKAVVLYRHAGELFALQGQSISAGKAKKMADDLGTLIRSYSPTQ